MGESVRDVLVKILAAQLEKARDCWWDHPSWCPETIDAMKPHIIDWAVRASQDYAKHAFDMGIEATIKALHQGGLLDDNELNILMEGLREDGATGIGVRVPNLDWGHSD